MQFNNYMSTEQCSLHIAAPATAEGSRPTRCWRGGRGVSALRARPGEAGRGGYLVRTTPTCVAGYHCTTK